MRREPLLVYYAVLFFPVMLRQFLVYSESWRASWVFHAAPMPFDEIVVGLKNTVVSRFLVPYLLLVMLLLGWLYPRPPLELADARPGHRPALARAADRRPAGQSVAAVLAADAPGHSFVRAARADGADDGDHHDDSVLAAVPVRHDRHASFLGVAVLVVVNVLLHETLLTRVERLSRQWACTS